jgi:hypothetical protein
MSSTSKSKSEPAVDERDMDDKETSHDRVPFLVPLVFLFLSGLKKEGISTILFASSLRDRVCERQEVSKSYSKDREDELWFMLSFLPIDAKYYFDESKLARFHMR